MATAKVTGSSVAPRWTNTGPSARAAQVGRARYAAPGTHPSVLAPAPLMPASRGMLKG